MTLPRTELSRRSHRSAVPQRLGGPEGNERLTALTGAVLLVLFAAEGVTLLRLGRLLYWHYAIGFLLIGPVCLKIAATVYRFTRYYTRHEPYVRKGPPHPLLRIIGPLIVLSTIAVLGTGVLLAVQHTSQTYFGFQVVFPHIVLALGAGVILAEWGGHLSGSWYR